MRDSCLREIRKDKRLKWFDKYINETVFDMCIDSRQHPQQHRIPSEYGISVRRKRWNCHADAANCLCGFMELLVSLFREQWKVVTRGERVETISWINSPIYRNARSNEQTFYFHFHFYQTSSLHLRKNYQLTSFLLIYQKGKKNLLSSWTKWFEESSRDNDLEENCGAIGAGVRILSGETWARCP